MIKEIHYEDEISCFWKLGRNPRENNYKKITSFHYIHEILNEKSLIKLDLLTPQGL